MVWRAGRRMVGQGTLSVSISIRVSVNVSIIIPVLIHIFIHFFFFEKKPPAPPQTIKLWAFFFEGTKIAGWK